MTKNNQKSIILLDEFEKNKDGENYQDLYFDFPIKNADRWFNTACTCSREPIPTFTKSRMKQRNNYYDRN